MHKKSQAALEFLTTYAWAFLVIIIMVGALAYFGVLSPSKLLPDRCNFGSEVGCNKDLLVVNNVETGTLTMRLENNVGAPITVTEAIITTDIAVVGACTAKLNAVDPDPTLQTPVTFPWPSDLTVTFTADCNDAAAAIGGNQLVEKEKVKFNIEISYYPSAAGATYKKSVFGEVFTTIQ